MKINAIIEKDTLTPAYARKGDAGMDLRANIQEAVSIEPLERRLIPTGLFIELPVGFEAQIRPRSGLAIKHGISLVNTPGTIDSDYRGLINLIVVNFGKEDFVVKRGQRLAQMIIKEVTQAELVEVDELDETVRAHGGFGHTGI